jgi:hypothetical protein
MASFKGKGKVRNRGSSPRRGRDGHLRRLALESLESRRLLAGGGTLWQPTTTNITDTQNGPLANAGQNLIRVYLDYQKYLQDGSVGSFATSTDNSLRNILEFQGNDVGVDVKGLGDPTTFLTDLRADGMQIQNYDSSLEIAEGLVPVANLVEVATLVPTVGVSPIILPMTYCQGIACNQGDFTLGANVARQQYGVTGAGVKVGVLSNSVNQFDGGIAASQKTGDLPSNITVIQDGMAGGDDEGRAMLENIYDIAPGATLGFATAEGGDLNFANNINALATSFGANIIVDDVGYADEPMFQDGIISQAVANVATKDNVVYFSAAGNEANQGYQSFYRSVTATVPGIGTGDFMNFAPTGTPVTELPITVNTQGTIDFQFSEPWYTATGVTSNVQIFILDSNNNVVASGTSNTIATQQPFQFFDSPGPGTYKVAIEVVSGPDPQMVRFQAFSANITVSQQFGSAGGTTYPTTFGHPTSQYAIGVGAVPFWGAPPYLNPSTVLSEPFSSFGPAVIFFNPDGTPLSVPQTRLKPDLSGPDGGATSFFGFGPLNTTMPPFPGEPATPTNVVTDTLPHFFGTSSAAPNLAAVAALMEQLQPGSSKDAIESAMIASATPLNGATKGAWDPQGGYGLVNAVAALNAIDMLRVSSTVPANGQLVTTAPSFITVTFSKPVNTATLSAANLVFASAPTGVTVTDSNPIEISPTVFEFPIIIHAAPGTIANGLYSFLIAGLVYSTDGKPLVPYAAIFNLQDTTPPRITNLTVSGRVIVIDFSKPMNPATINTSTVLVLRTGAAGVFPAPTNVLLNNDPRLTVVYDAINNRAIIDMTQLDQTELPTDNYMIAVLDTVTDEVGNQLEGQFNGVFPTGQGATGPGNFVDFLPNQVLTAPTVYSISLAPQSDSGIPGDSNTNITQPTFVGQVVANFPATYSNVEVAFQFNPELQSPANQLNVGLNGRGFTGTPDGVVMTNGQGQFTLTAPYALPDGFNTLRVVVVGAPDAPPLPGLSSLRDMHFRVDTSLPMIISSSIPNGANIPTLTSLTLSVVDPVLPSDPTSPLAVPVGLNFPALNPATADNVSNYSLINLGPDGIPGTADDRDYSSYITSASFVSTTARANPNDPYTGTISLTFAPGLPAGTYWFVARTPGNGYQGLQDAAGNPLNGTPTQPYPSNYLLVLHVQPTPVYITDFMAVSPTPDPNNGMPFSVYGPRSYFEVPTPGDIPRAPAPPQAFVFDFSAPLNPNANYNSDIELIRSANSPAAPPDGDFGVDGVTGFTPVVGTSVTLTNSIPGAQPGQPGYDNRLVLRLAPGTTLPPDVYRIIIPNTGSNAIYDIYGNQLDGEFLGNPASAGSVPEVPTVGAAVEPPIQYEDLLPNGQYRQNDLSGDGTPGGTFVTSIIVVPTGNIIYAKPDAPYDPFNDITPPDGSLQRPYPALAPEAVPNAFNGGDLNSNINYFHFDPGLDRNGDGHFDPSAIYAAQVASAKGPVVIIALPGTPHIDPTTGQTVTPSFVSQAPAGPDPLYNNASFSLPFDTTMIMAPGSALKLQNATVLVQNQGTALMALGGPNPSQEVYFTSYADDSVGGPSRPPGDNTPPQAGDWGGIVFRNFMQQGRTDVFPVDGTLQGLNGTPAISGEDDALSLLNFTTIRYGGGAVPQTGGANLNVISVRYDSIMNFNARPAITNDLIADTGSVGSGVVTGTQAAISGDLDSFREDSVARGILVRRTQLINNSINGIWVRPEDNGDAEPTNAVPLPNNPSTMGGWQNYTFDDPLPYVLLSRLVIGTQFLEDTNGQTTNYLDRLYIQPGMMVKSIPGAGIDAVTPGASINIGSRSYITGYDQNHNYSPLTPGFVQETANDAPVVFTSFYDDKATTSYFDPITQTTTIIVPAIDTSNDGGTNQPTPGNVPRAARWGGVSIMAGVRAVINDAQFWYGGGPLNQPNSTVGLVNVLNLETSTGDSPFMDTSGVGAGAYVYVTNNSFYYNLDAAIAATPDSFMVGNPLTPLNSGHPFFRNNIMQGNTYDGLRVLAAPGINNINPPSGISDGPVPINGANQHVNAVWDSTDLTYVLRGTITLAGYGMNQSVPQPNQTSFTAELQPAITLTIQSALPGTLLADGSTIPKPGESVIVKLLGFAAAPGTATAGSTGADADANAGAGFIVGADNGVDPPNPDFLVDPGAYSQIRILGIPGNQTTGQARVPAIITSLFDDTVGTTVRGVKMYDIFNPPTTAEDPNYPTFDPMAYSNGTLRTAPAPGDWGLILFGANSLPSYDLTDPRGGNLIDNADIRYGTRIEMQGGGVVDVYDLDKDGMDGNVDLADNARLQQLGITPPTQYNTAKAMTISNSNLAFFSQDVLLAHPSGFGMIAHDVLGEFTATEYQGGYFRNSSTAGEPTDLYMVNDTISNSPFGVNVLSNTGSGPFTMGDTMQDEPIVILQNNTFYNNGIAFNTVSPQGMGGSSWNSFSAVRWLAINNIFANSTTAAIMTTGQTQASTAQYNLFNGNKADVVIGPQGTILFPAGGFGGNWGVQTGDPDFHNAAALDFRLDPNSAAIDAGRSEFGPNIWGNTLQPTVNQVLSSNPFDTTGGIRNNTGRLGALTDWGLFPIPTNALVTLPGSALQSYATEWVAAIPGTPGSYEGPASNADTFAYAPVTGERDQLGNLRIDDPNKPNVGFGSKPFFDIGAFEYIPFNPPVVTAVAALVSSPTSPGGITAIPIYQPGSIGGSNQTPLEIVFAFNQPLNPSTINSMTVELQESGGDGIFGNNNSPLDRTINLSGKLSYDPINHFLIVSLAGLNLPNDEYRITLFGTGNNVIASPTGEAISGVNTLNDDPNNPQLPLPSGDGYPGSNFYLSFTILTIPSSVVPGTVMLSPASDSNPNYPGITNINEPTIVGQITDQFPAIDPLGGQTVEIDVSTAGDGNFNLIDVGTGTTDSTGHFSVKITTPLPDSPVHIGASGVESLNGDTTGYSVFRVRVIDHAGNQSNPNDPNAMGRFIIDTTGPRVISSSPLPNTEATVVNGSVTITLLLNQNLDPSTVNSSTVKVLRSGGTGVFTSTSPTVTPTSVSLGSPQPFTGFETITIVLSGNLPNDLYEVVLLGTGSQTVNDLAGNPVNAVGATPTGNYVLPFAIFNPAAVSTLWVGQNVTPYPGAPLGSYQNPYTTIGAAMAAANIGDVIAVYPGVYTETVMMKSLVKLIGVAAGSTPGNLIPDNPLNTVIRAAQTSTGSSFTVAAVNLISIAGLQTEIRGFTIASPLTGNPATGTIGSTIGLVINNSNVLVDKDYFIDSLMGVALVTSGAAAPESTLNDDVIAGNVIGVEVNDSGTTTSLLNPVELANNDFVYNTFGLVLYDTSPLTGIADVVNNIFWQNNDLSGNPANGAAIIAAIPNKTLVRYNLFGTGNGIVAQNVGTGFNPAVLGPTPDALGNFAGNPAFAFPSDPRPNSVDGPGVFFNNANFDLTFNSPAINNALQSSAPATDILSRSPVKIDNKGFPGRGPASIGAFYFGGTPTSSISTTGSGGSGGGSGGQYYSTASAGAASTNPPAQTAMATAAATKSGNNPTVTPNDLVLGSINVGSSNPTSAPNLSWVDGHSVAATTSAAAATSAAVPLSTNATPPAAPTVALPSASGSSNAPASAASAVAPAATSPAPSASAVTFTPSFGAALVGPAPFNATTTPVAMPAPATPAPVSGPVWNRAALGAGGHALPTPAGPTSTRTRAGQPEPFADRSHWRNLFGRFRGRTPRRG